MSGYQVDLNGPHEMDSQYLAYLSKQVIDTAVEFFRLLDECKIKLGVKLVPLSLMWKISGGSRISPRRGRQLPRGGRQHTILPNFPKNCMKLKEFGPPGGGARPKFYYVDPPLKMYKLQTTARY